MTAFDEAEMLCIPLEKSVLNIKLLMSKFGSTTELLQQSLSSPPVKRVATAIRYACHLLLVAYTAYFSCVSSLLLN
jgi:hypothetical protein